MATKKAKSTKKKSGPKLAKEDIVRAIMEDHKTIKKLIKTLKSEKVDIDEKREAFATFVPTLLNHAKPEEQALYMKMRQDESLRAESFEAETEHQIAERLAFEIKNVEDNDEWEGKVKVVAELVEHHIEEEEEDLLKQVQKEFTAEEREEMGREFLRLKEADQLDTPELNPEQEIAA